jgi:excisionase family DNA binding protein
MGMITINRGISPSQAANRLGTSAKTVKELAAAGKLRAEHTVLGMLVNPEDVERLRQERAAERAANDGR